MPLVNFQNFSLFCSLFRLLAASFYRIDGNFKATAADLILSKFGGGCDMLPHYCEWIAVLFYIRSGHNQFTQSSDTKVSAKTGKSFENSQVSKMRKNQLSKVFHTPNKFYLS